VPGRPAHYAEVTALVMFFVLPQRYFSQQSERRRAGYGGSSRYPPAAQRAALPVRV